MPKNNMSVNLIKLDCDHKLATMKIAFVFIFFAAGFGFNVHATMPVVAIHDSELTRALETMPATGLTPTGSGTTGSGLSR